MTRDTIISARVTRKKVARLQAKLDAANKLSRKRDDSGPVFTMSQLIRAALDAMLADKPDAVLSWLMNLED